MSWHCRVGETLQAVTNPQMLNTLYLSHDVLGTARNGGKTFGSL